MADDTKPTWQRHATTPTCFWLVDAEGKRLAEAEAFRGDLMIEIYPSSEGLAIPLTVVRRLLEENARKREGTWTWGYYPPESRLPWVHRRVGSFMVEIWLRQGFEWTIRHISTTTLVASGSRFDFRNAESLALVVVEHLMDAYGE